MEMSLPAGYTARPYRGTVDHPTMAEVLGAVRKAASDSELPTAEGFDITYGNFPPEHCVPTRDTVLIDQHDDQHRGGGGAVTTIGYARAAREIHDGDRLVVNWMCFPVIHPDHQHEELVVAVMRGLERHLRTVTLTDPQPTQFLAFAPHPGPGLPAAGPAAWLEAMGYEAFAFGATLVRPHLDDIPDLPLPVGVEIRPVEPHQVREIWDVHQEAFRGQWDFHELTEAEFEEYVAQPFLDTSLWKVAWDERGVVGQVKTFVNTVENEVEGRRRGYTEHISVRADQRNRGVAAALLCASLRELRDRGFTEAALGADVDNPAAFGLYQRLGFVVTSYEGVYRRPIGSDDRPQLSGR